jgi:hypothetical protein
MRRSMLSRLVIPTGMIAVAAVAGVSFDFSAVAARKELSIQ